MSEALSNQEEENTSHDEDELQSFLLRAELDEMEFSFVWRCMQSLGWKHKGGKYITPDGIDLGSSKDAMKTLDRYVLPSLSLRDNLCSRGGENDGYFDEMKMKLKEVRRNLLVSIYSNLDSESRKFDDDDDGDDDDDKKGPNESPYKDIISSGRKSKKNKCNSKSATTNERGTDQYFDNKRVTRSRKSQVECATELTQSKHNAQPQELKKATNTISWPKPKDNVKAMKNIMKERNDGGKDDHSVVTKLLQKNGSQWKFLLSTNHSLLFHGFGSKQKLLNDFALELKNCGDVLILDGNDPEISFSKSLDIIVVRENYFVCD